MIWKKEISKRQAFWSRSWFEGTFRDHARYENHTSSYRSRMKRHVQRFLGMPESRWHSRLSSHESYDLQAIHAAVENRLSDWIVNREIPIEDDAWAARYREVEVKHGVHQSLLAEGIRLYRLPNDQRRALMIEQFRSESGDCTYELSLIGPARDRDVIEQEHAGLTAWMRENHPLKFKAIRANGAILPPSQNVDWDSVSLAREIKSSLLANTVELLSRRELFAKNGLPLTRGILLYGPPGTGKTMIGRVLAGLGQATFVWMTAGDTRGFRSTFNLARRLRPTILFLEDLDFYASERSGGTDRETLGELLTQLDGMESNDGLIVVATTNDLSAIEPALKYRPSRFDVVLEIGLPDESARRSILARTFQDRPLSESILEKVARRTTGLSGAQVQEVARRVIHAAVYRGAVDINGMAFPEQVDIEQAIQSMNFKPKGTIGFGG